MARKKQSRGKCAFCGRELTKGGMAKHLQTCSQRSEAVSKAAQGDGEEQNFYHLQIQGAWGCGDYWLHVEMQGSATLNKLDQYLRAIWLECCGHLSQFSLEGWSSDEISKRRKAELVFKPGLELVHIYDFGSSTETLIKVVGVRQGKPLTAHPLYLMARNDMPEETCGVCGKPATLLCMECITEEDGPEAVCDEHAKKHSDHDYALMPIFNSPRTGVCGYEGPAEPPY
ncbi:hypothetical protein VU05_01515 [Desulfobulbus sp. F1]|nr:hypothetical protein [Desulfobulbus sp. F1]